MLCSPLKVTLHFAETCCLHPEPAVIHFLYGLFFNCESGGIMFLQNIDWLSVDYMAL
jgi:hypothetical protein